MERVLEIASTVSTPLGLGGLFAAIVFFIFKQILQRDLFPRLSRDHSAALLKLIVDRLFVLALVAMVLGFSGYVLATVLPVATGGSQQAEPTEEVGARQPAKPVVYKTCRHPDFGQEGWARSETVDQSSGWRDGGSSPQNWCNELANGFVQARAIGSQHSVEVLDKGESSDRDWKGHVTYNYRCVIRISWEPVYVEKQDPRCGLAD